jgi:6-phosphofructokinase 1
VVGYKHGEYCDFDIDEALAMQKDIPEYEYEVTKSLSI